MAAVAARCPVSGEQEVEAATIIEGSGLEIEFRRRWRNGREMAPAGFSYGGRRLALIDPDDDGQVDQLARALGGDFYYGDRGALAASLRRYATVESRPIEEPTDPAARVYCPVSGERTEWVRVVGALPVPIGAPEVIGNVWINGWGGRLTWEELVEEYGPSIEVVSSPEPGPRGDG